MNAETVKQFATIFRGRTDAWGALHGECVHEKLSLDHYRRQLSGEVSLGIYPLRTDGTCHWASTDFDDDNVDTALELMKALYELGVNVGVQLERSKSKGYHVWLFLDAPAPAKDVRLLLRAALRKADLPPSVEIFPKQDTLADTPDKVGSYIHLPYFGDNGDGRRQFCNLRTLEPVPLETFLSDYTPFPTDLLALVIENLSPELSAPAERKAAAPEVGDVIPEGERDNTLTSLAGTFRRRGLTGDEIMAALLVINDNRCETPLPAADVERIAKSVGRYAPAESAHYQGNATDQGEVPAFEALALDTLLAEEDEALEIVLSDGADGAILTVDGKGFVAGPTGVGKTNLLLRLSRCLCEGQGFLDLPIPHPRRVLYLALEGSRRGMRRRLRKVWADADPEARQRFKLALLSLNLAEEDDFQRLQDLLTAARPEVLIIDPLRNAHPWDENSSQEAARLTSVLDSIMGRHQCAIIAAHHDRKRPPLVRRDVGTDRVRGSTALTGWLTFCLSIDPDPQGPDQLVAEWTKTRDAETALESLALDFDRKTLDFFISERAPQGKVSEDAIINAVAECGGSVRGVALIAALKEGCGAGERCVRERLRELAKAGKLIPYTAPEDRATRAKSYRLPDADTLEVE